MVPNRIARLATFAASLIFISGAAFAAPQIVVRAFASTPKAAPKDKPSALAVQFNAPDLFALAPGDLADLTLPNGTQYTYLYEQTIDHGGGFRTWIARSPVIGDDVRAIITNGPGGTWGWMRTPYGEYRIYPGEGVDLLTARAPRDFSPTFPGGDAVPAPDDPPSPLKDSLKGFPTFAPEPLMLHKGLVRPKAAPAGPVVADVMIIYTKDLADKLGAGLMPMILNLIASANQAYVDSEISLSLRLVNATMLVYPNANGSSDTLSSMNSSTALYASYFQSLTWGAGSVRDTVGADLVAMVRDGPDDTGGIGFVLKNASTYPGIASPLRTSAYSVNNYCASGCEGIFAHELGHNMGNAHDRATVARDNNGVVTPSGSLSDGVFSYSYDHYFCTSGTLTCNPFTPGGCPLGYASCASQTANDFGTIMSYFSPRVMKFSNPSVNCSPSGGTPPGPTCGIAGQDDNAQSMNNVRASVSAYRSATIGALPGSLQFTNTAFSGTETGGTITFTVSRASGSSGAVNVNYAVSGGTAIAGIDFTAASGTLSWANGDSASKTFSVPVANDVAPEGIETLSATLSNPTGAIGVYLGYPTTATGFILETWPPGGNIPSGWVNPAASSAPWAPANDSAYDADGTSLKSGALNFAVKNCVSSISLYGNVPCPSILEFTGTFVAGSITYAYRVSSFPDNGFLEFRIDGYVVQQASGSQANADSGWQLVSIPITAGAHTIRWQYRPVFGFPCAVANTGGPPPYPTCLDRAWIDAVSLPLSVAASSAALLSNANPATIGQNVTFTATVSGSAGAPSGTVAFRDGPTAISGCQAVAVASNSAACSTTSLASGSHSITAAYSGSRTYGPSVSSTLTQTVLSTVAVTITITKSGAGAGVVSSLPGGLNCGATCTANFNAGASLTLSAVANGGSVFTGWSGGGCTAAGSCVIAPTAATTGNASFALLASSPTPQASPASLDFGSQSMQTTTLSFPLSVINAGTGTLTISGVSVSDTQFSQTNNCTTLATGANCTVTLTFTPTAQGTVTGNLIVNTSAGTLTVPLTGVGERSLVTHYYRTILSRAPDSAGKAFWEGEAARMSSLGADINEVWFVMAGYFLNSSEYLAANKTDAQFVTDLYNTFFNRAPDAGGLGYWTGQIAGGLPREVVLFSFMFSPEFRTFTTGIFGNTVARPEVNLVMDFFRGVLNRLPDTPAYNYWVGQLKVAQCAGAGAVYTKVDEISYTFIFGPEYTNRARTNTQFVTDMYYSFLRRGGDATGVNYWVNQLNTGAKNRNTERGDFLTSPEFGARVSAVIAAGCQP